MPPVPTNIVPQQSSTPSGDDPLAKRKAAEKDQDLWSNRAGAMMRRKKGITPLEDRLSKDPFKSTEICRWARIQYGEYRSGLNSWYANRARYLSEMNDIFEHRRRDLDAIDSDDNKPVFQLSNDSLNIVAAMAEFAAAQADQDIFGGDPWFAAKPVGVSDEKLADNLQRHLAWKLRDNRLVSSFGRGISLAAFTGEYFTKASYVTQIDEYEAAKRVLFSGKGAVLVDGKMVPDTTPLEEATALAQSVGATGPFSWSEVYKTETVVVREGSESVVLNHSDVAFREDATELCLEQTSFYALTTMTVARARKAFNLSKEDAIRLALAAGWASDRAWMPGENDHILDALSQSPAETSYGEDFNDQLLNSRVQLIEGWVRMDPFGDGVERSIYIVFPPNHEDWLVYANYIGNLSPKATLPVFVHCWEQKSGRLYGRGFIEKYGAYQVYVDNLWNQVSFRNAMHANPITGYKPTIFRRDEDDGDLDLKPGKMLELLPDKDLKDGVQFLEMPDLDSRSMELMQTAIQIMQLRSGITSASQGDMTGLPQNNTATGIRQLMSRAAVLLKRPIRSLRRSFGCEFSLHVKLIYANLNVEETFLVGEGANTELVSISPEQVADLDIDVLMLLTQEQNQTKYESASNAIAAFQAWLSVPEGEKAEARIVFLQIMKALDFDQADNMIRQARPTLIDMVATLPEDQMAEAMQVIEAGYAALQAPQTGAPAPDPQNPA